MCLALRPQTEGNISNGAIAISHSARTNRYTGCTSSDKRFSSHYLLRRFLCAFEVNRLNGVGNGPIKPKQLKEATTINLPTDAPLTFSGFVDLPTYEGKIDSGAGVEWLQLGLIMPMVSKPPLSNLLGNVDLDGDGLTLSSCQGDLQWLWHSLWRGRVALAGDQFNTNCGQDHRARQPIPKINTAG